MPENSDRITFAEMFNMTSARRQSQEAQAARSDSQDSFAQAVSAVYAPTLIPTPTSSPAQVQDIKWGNAADSLRGADANKSAHRELYLPRHEGGLIRIRFLGIHQTVYRKWDNALHKYINYADSNAEDGLKTAVASFVIDRHDGDMVKVILCPEPLFIRLGEDSPDDDFTITRYGKRLSTTYEPVSNGQTSVSGDLLDNIQHTATIYSLVDIFTQGIQWKVVEMPVEPIECRFDILDL